MRAADLTHAQLLAVHRVGLELGGADKLRSLRVDGAPIEDLRAAMQRARLAWDEAAKPTPTAAAELARTHLPTATAATAGLWSRVKRYGTALIDRLYGLIRAGLEPRGHDDISTFRRFLARTLIGGKSGVVRRTRLDVALASGAEYHVTARVVDVPATKRARQLEASAVAIATAPGPGFFPVVGNLYGATISLTTALIAGCKAHALLRRGDRPAAQAYRGIRDRQLKQVVHRSVPGWAFAVEAITAIDNAKKLTGLEVFAAPDKAVRLGTLMLRKAAGKV